MKIAISEHVKTAAVFDSAMTAASFDSAMTVVASDPVTPAVVFYSAMTVVASAAPTDVVSDQLTASSDFVRILACQSHASRLHCPSSELDHSNPLRDAY